MADKCECGKNDCKAKTTIITANDLEKAKVDLISERIMAREDFELLTKQLREQYISMRTAPYQKTYSELLKNLENKE